MKVKEESERAGLKLNIQKTKIMASVPITSWQMDGEKMGTVTDLKTWESLGLQGDQTSHPKGNQPWIFTGRTDAEAETPVLWPPDVKRRLTGKDPDAGKDWEGRRKRGWQKLRCLDCITNSMDMSLNKFQEIMKGRKPGMLQSMGLKRVRNDWATEQQGLVQVLWSPLTPMGSHITTFILDWFLHPGFLRSGGPTVTTDSLVVQHTAHTQQTLDKCEQQKRLKRKWAINGNMSMAVSLLPRHPGVLPPATRGSHRGQEARHVQWRSSG